MRGPSDDSEKGINPSPDAKEHNQRSRPHSSNI
jgi:hypothetical protein